MLIGQGMWLSGRLCGPWPGDATGDTPWVDWGNAAVNESLTATKTVGVRPSCLSLRKRWISPPLKAPLKRPSKVYLPPRPLVPARRVWLLAGFTTPEFAFHGSQALSPSSGVRLATKKRNTMLKMFLFWFIQVRIGHYPTHQALFATCR